MPILTDHPEYKFQWRFFGPRFWGSWLLLLLLWIMMWMPRRVVMVTGAWVGDQFRKRNKKRRRIVEVNMALCFPELDDAGRDRLVVEHFRSYGRSLMDMGLSLWGSRERINSLVDAEGLAEHCEVVKQHNAMVVTWHLTTLEISGSMLSMSGPVVSMMNRMNNPLMTWLFARGRGHLTDVALVMRDNGFRAFIGHMRKGQQGLIIPDEDLGVSDASTVFVPFFGVQRALLTTPARLAKSARAKVVTCAARLDAASGRYIYTITPPLEGVDGSDLEADTRAIAASMEQLIRKAPAQYMWTFRWFRTRQDGGDSPYDPVPQTKPPG